ncbi:MAG: 4-hydroxybenzoate octaprenyltransferase [Magnetospirillum sp. WYHS-4]
MTEAVKSAASDIPSGHWVDRLVPRPLRPYLRLARVDRPIGTWLLLFPGWWSLALAADGRPDLRLFGLFALGALVMRGAGCTVNDIADRDVDGRVARTATRPIPAGEVTVFQALLFLVVLCSVGLAVLLQFNPIAIMVGGSSLVLIAVYPLMKRVTYWPQAVLGLAFNWGALLGWAAVRGELDWPALALYAGGIFWTLGYDTIYAHQDKEDDILIGVKSTALRLGAATRTWLYGFYGAALAFFGLAGGLAGLAWPFYLGLAVAGLHLGWQAAKVDTDDPRDCLDKFKSNRYFGWLLLGAVLAG